MATRPWRGTLLYVGAAAAMTAAGIAKFSPAPTDATASGATSASTGSAPSAPSGTTSDGTTGSGAPSNGTSGSGATSNGTTGSGATSTDNSGSTTSDTVTIVGSVEQNRYGSVQVSVTFTGSQITDVQTLQVPNRDRESVQINQYAAPVLAHEVVAAQSAHIDSVSGASYTSESYARSVQSAIDQHG